jgi:hypothetical protein
MLGEFKLFLDEFLKNTVTFTYKEGLHFMVITTAIGYINGYRMAGKLIFQKRRNLFYDINILYTRREKKKLKYLL